MKKRLWNIFSILLLASMLGGCGVEGYLAREEFRVDASSPEASLSANGEVVQRLFLIGDAGEPMPEGREPVLRALSTQLSVEPEKNILLYLGDNDYPAGLPAPADPDRTAQEHKLDEQMQVLERSGARGIFLPGNHDWDKGSSDGWDRVRFQADYIRSKKNPYIEYYPRDGCPGPAVLNVGGHLRLVLLDTQWWLHAGPRPEGPSSPCDEKTERDILDALATAIRTAGGRRVVVAGHHALASHGPHGGFFTWTDHLFPLRGLAPWLWIPLPGIGSLYPLSRLMGITRADLSNPTYRHMAASIDSVLSAFPPLAYAAGHEHVLQVLKRENRPWFDLVSGNGASVHNSSVTTGEDTFLADPHPGFMRIDLFPGRAELHVIQPDGAGKPVEIFRLRMDEWVDGKAAGVK